MTILIRTSAEHDAGVARTPLFVAEAMRVRLFPEGVALAELRGPGDMACLHPSERLVAARYGPSRRRDFAAGRCCARHALAAFGFGEAAVLANDDGSPRWPGGIVGSITHTAGSSAAAVARAERFAGIGLDVERRHDVPSDLWPRLFTVSERRRLRALGPEERSAAACAVFAAKEAFYKCQHPLAGRAYAWTDADVTLDAGRDGTFVLSLCEPHSRLPAEFEGRYRIEPSRVLAGMALSPERARRLPPRGS